jgi:hypothetical protein
MVPPHSPLRRSRVALAHAISPYMRNCVGLAKFGNSLARFGDVIGAILHIAMGTWPRRAVCVVAKNAVQGGTCVAMKSGRPEGILSRCVCGAMLLLAGLHAVVDGARPSTIPAIREWTDGSGSWTFTNTTRVVAGSDASLAVTAALFARELSTLGGWTVPVVQNGSHAGDVVLSVDSSDAQLGAQGYRLAVTDRVAIQGRPSGVLNGTRTVLKLLRSGATVGGGIARD